LPVAAAQGHGQHAVGHIVLGQRARVDQGKGFIATDDLVVEATKRFMNAE